MNAFYVYTYIDPRDGEPFYIGKGKGRRAYSHLTASVMQRGLDKGWFFYHKLQKLLASGTSPEIRFLCKELTEDQALYWETFFIGALGRRDIKTGCLCNMTSGGDGPSGRVVSEETRQKLSKVWKGRKHSAETRRKISESKQNMSVATRQKISKARKGIVFSDEHRHNLSKGQKQRFARPEERAKISISRKGMVVAEITGHKISAAHWRNHWRRSGGTTRLNTQGV